MSEKQLSFDCAMKIVNKQKWIQIKDIERLEKFIQNQQATITHLEKVNGKNFAKRRLLEQDNLVLRNENEQLRQQHQRVYNYFRDYLEDEMSAENFGEMWDNVKEDERWNDE